MGGSRYIALRSSDPSLPQITTQSNHLFQSPHSKCEGYKEGLVDSIIGNDITSVTMSIQVVSMIAADIPEMFRIRDSALLPSQAPISCLIFRPPFSPRIWQRETERLEQNDGTYFLYKAVDDQGILACMRARWVPPQAEDAAKAAVTIPAWRESDPIGKTVWDAVCTQLAEAKKRSFDNVSHYCM
jgi:hypothetical protein